MHSINNIDGKIIAVSEGGYSADTIQYLFMTNGLLDTLNYESAYVGLPGHHASSEQGPKGFCVFNSTTFIVHTYHQLGIKNFTLVGTDINDDNGIFKDMLSSISRWPDVHITHVNIVDPSIYPH